MFIASHGAPTSVEVISSLLIDSSEMNGNLTKIYMEIAGCNVRTCEDFGQAASLLSDPTREADCMFDLVVIDSRTIMKHFKVLRAVRSSPDHRARTISIIPEHRIGAVIELFEAGSNAVVTYPYATGAFIDAIHRCLTTPQDRNSRNGCDGAHSAASGRKERDAVASAGC